MYLVIDIGSNTIRAVVFRMENGKLLPVLNKKYSAGLAGYVDKNDAMSSEGISLCVDILSEIEILTRAIPFDAVYPFATASLRNIENSEEVLEKIKAETGLDVTVLSGAQEAFFDYFGTTLSIKEQEGILVDIGGGSTEVVSFCQGRPVRTESLPIGSLNMFNRYVEGLIPEREEVKAIQKEVRKALDELGFDHEIKTKTLTGVGGTARAALKLYNGIYRLDKNNKVFSADFLKNILRLKWDEQKLMKQILKTAPERIHTLIPGIAVLSAAAEYFGAEKIEISSSGVREGYLYYQLEKGGGIDAQKIYAEQGTVLAEI